MSTLNSSRPIALALGGGAARGWAHVGVIRQLLASGFEIAAVAGTSIGALVGAFLAAGKAEILWQEIAGYRKRDLLRFFDPAGGGDGLVSGNRVEEFLREKLGVSEIADLTMPYGAIAVDLASGAEVEMTSGGLVAAIRASISIPGVFSAVRRDGRILVDGGVANPVPVGLARRLGGGCPVLAVGLNKDIPESLAAAGGDAADTGDTTWASQLAGALRSWIRRKHARGIIPLATASMVAVEQHLTLARLQAEPADFYIEPDLGNVDLFDFHKAETAMLAGKAALAKIL